MLEELNTGLTLLIPADEFDELVNSSILTLTGEI